MSDESGIHIPRFRNGLYPSGGWTVNLPDGMTLAAGSREELETKVTQHLGLTPEKAKDYVDARLCVRYPSSCEGGKATRNISLSLSDRASLFLLSFEGKPPILRDKATVVTRLATCADCPANGGLTTPGCCGSPKAIEALTRSLADKHAVHKPFGAGWCGILGANITLAAHLSQDGFITQEDAAHDSLPPSCPYRSR